MARPESTDPVLADLGERVRAALVAADLPDADPAFERPKAPEHGDWATTVPLRLAKVAGRPPREIAQRLVDHLELPNEVASVEVAGPGFVNLRFAQRYHEQLIRRILTEGLHYARTELPVGERESINVEFVSANPTGPLHIGAGRWAATGDAIAELLGAAGHAVTREYYVNDAGEQVRRFGESVVLLARDEQLGDGHYRGDYVGDIATELVAAHGMELVAESGGAPPDPAVGGAEHDRDGRLVEDAEPARADVRVAPDVAARVGELAVEAMRARIEGQLHQLGVDFDVWFSERSLHDAGRIAETITTLTEGGHTYDADGATFLRTEVHGDDKDRVLLRSDGRPTYFAADCAYLRDKWARTSEHGAPARLIYILGADHHGYVARMHAAAACLGLPADRVEIRIGQLVNLLRGGETVQMSKRAGELVTLDEVVDEVGVDVTRYHFLRQSLDSMVEFDLETVASQSMDNPIYYVQYAHARINTLLKAADDRGFDPGDLDDAPLDRLTHPAELALLTGLAQQPLVVAEAAELRATQRLARYAEELAGTFHRFYAECRILPPGWVGSGGEPGWVGSGGEPGWVGSGGEPDDPDGSDAEAADLAHLGRARYWLAVAAKQVLADALGLLRVAAPERM